MAALYAEMDALETPEAKLYKALDKLEAVISAQRVRYLAPGCPGSTT